MRLAILMPRGTHFSAKGATSIDLCVADFVRTSRHRAETVVLGAAIDQPFADLRYETVSTPTGFSLLPNKVRWARDLALQAAKHKPDVILVEQHPETAAVVCRTLPSVPVVLHRHGLPRLFKPGLRLLRHRKLYSALAGVIWVGHHHKLHFDEMFPALKARSFHVPNGIDLADWHGAPPAAREKSIVYVGRLTREKGVVELSSAAQRFLAKNPDWSMHWIVSSSNESGDLLPILQAMTEQFGARVSVRQDIELKDIKHTLKTAGVAVIPSIVLEGYPRVAMEAHAAGCAVISSGSGGLRALSADAAIYLPSVSDKAIFDALSTLHDDSTRAHYQTLSVTRAEEALSLVASTRALDDALEQSRATFQR
jgi:glycosyltransferase involved in cell wall biosynthesis